MALHLPYVAGAAWCTTGLFLMTKGLFLSAQGNNPSPLFSSLAQTAGSSGETIALYILAALALGSIKSKIVFKKSARKNMERISQIPQQKQKLFHTFALKDYLLIGFMMGLGLCMSAMNVYSDVRGFILVAVGAALLQGSVAYLLPQQKECPSRQ